MKNNKVKKPVCLVILDGWGASMESENDKECNAICAGKTPNMDRYLKEYPNTTLKCSGEAVGLPEGQMGNSEVGHLNIGAGRIIYQEYTRISKSIDEGDFFKNEVLLEAIDNLKDKKNGSLHLMGLVSDGGVHSHIKHLKGLIKLAKENNVKNLYIHAFLDGRDVPPRSAIPYLEEVDKYLDETGIGEIATVSGRYYSMDRDNRWDRTEKGYNAIVKRQAESFNSAVDVVKNSYDSHDLDDEFVIPAIVKVRDEENAKVKDGDSVIFFNFRPDRARQLTEAFICSKFDKFNRCKNVEVFYVCMTRYNKNFDAKVAFPPNRIDNTLGEVVSKNGLRQLRIAETEKYAHVTFFFNGGVERPNEGEDRILIPSPKVKTYDLKPEMSAYEVTDTVIKKIKENIYDLIVLNFANPDMVGHTGILKAAVKAVETIDCCVERVVSCINENNGIALLTADHGNVEKMKNKDGSTVTAHTTSDVPFIVCDKTVKRLRGMDGNIGRLSDIAPTILELLGIEKPQEMTGDSIIIN